MGLSRVNLEGEVQLITFAKHKYVRVMTPIKCTLGACKPCFFV